MRFIMPLLCVALLLGGCATTATNNVPPEKCIVPDAMLVKAPRLPVIVPDKNGKASLDMLFNTWLDDINKYNHLKSKDDALIDWVQKYCEAALSTKIVTPEQPTTPAKQSTLFNLFGNSEKLAAPQPVKQPSLFGN